MKTTTDSHRRAGFPPASILLASAALLAAILPTAPLLHAQDAGPPVRAVRLSYVDGKVAISQDGQLVTNQAVANSPLLEGMMLTTADDGRAEVQFEDGSVARLSPNSSLTLKVLSGDGTSTQTEMDLNKGLAYFELQNSGQSGQMSVRFGDSVVAGSGFTILRVQDDMLPGELAVFSGNAHLERNSGLELNLHGGESVTLSGDDANGYMLAETIQPNSWDAWNTDRDQALNAEAATQTNAPTDLAGGQNNNPAWNDLDANGSWYNVPDQGYVWSPYDAQNASFDPYGNGSWEWTPGYGYTWASAYSWGYLPYQCGAWNFYGGFGWGWAPGFGGCTPWWGTGFYGGPFIGRAPGWYHPVRRPVGPGGRLGPGHAVIAVNRHPLVLNPGLPARDRNTPVAIDGQTVAALRPLPARSTYERAAFGVHSGYTAAMPTGAVAGGRSDYGPARPAYTPRPQGALGFNSTGGGAPQHTYAAPHYAPPARSYSYGGYHSSAGGGATHGGSFSGGGGTVGGGHR